MTGINLPGTSVVFDYPTIILIIGFINIFLCFANIGCKWRIKTEEEAQSEKEREVMLEIHQGEVDTENQNLDEEIVKNGDSWDTRKGLMTTASEMIEIPMEHIRLMRMSDDPNVKVTQEVQMVRRTTTVTKEVQMTTS